MDAMPVYSFLMVLLFIRTINEPADRERRAVQVIEQGGYRVLSIREIASLKHAQRKARGEGKQSFTAYVLMEECPDGMA